MNNAKMATDTYNLRKTIEVGVVNIEENGIKITTGGDLKIKKITLSNSEDNNLKNAINIAIRKAQELQVSKMKKSMDLESLS